MSENVTTLHDFLLARIAEDEAVAEAAIEDPHEQLQWAGRDYVPITLIDDGVWHAGRGHPEYQAERVVGKGITIYDEGGHSKEQAQHIARWDPARVLGECEAKRRIMEEHREDEIASLERDTWGKPFMVCHRCALPGERRVVFPCPTRKFLALPYADHEDYRDEWRP